MSHCSWAYSIVYLAITKIEQWWEAMLLKIGQVEDFEGLPGPALSLWCVVVMSIMISIWRRCWRALQYEWLCLVWKKAHLDFGGFGLGNIWLKTVSVVTECEVDILYGPGRWEPCESISCVVWFGGSFSFLLLLRVSYWFETALNSFKPDLRCVKSSPDSMPRWTSSIDLLLSPNPPSAFWLLQPA